MQCLIRVLSNESFYFLLHKGGIRFIRNSAFCFMYIELNMLYLFYFLFNIKSEDIFYSKKCNHE